jgi:hypothetical protein
MAKEIIFNLKVEDNLDSVDKQINEVVSSTDSLKNKFKELRTAAQEASDPEIAKRFAQAAGEIKDQIGDINSAINNFASDTKKLDVVVGTAQGIAGAFATVQGTMALFGSENKKLEETLLKVQGSLAVLNGLQQVAQVLNKESAVGAQLYAAANGILGSSFLAVEGGLKAFRLAMIATGIGAFVVAVGFLAAKFMEVKEKNDAATAAEKKYKEEMAAAKKTVDDKVASLNLEILAIKNKISLSGAVLLNAKAEKAALEEQIKTSEKYNEGLIESGNTRAANGKSLLIEVDALKKNLETKNQEIKNLELIAAKTKELEDAQKAQSDAEAKADADKKKRDENKKKADAENKKREDEKLEQLRKGQGAYEAILKKQAEDEKYWNDTIAEIDAQTAADKAQSAKDETLANQKKLQDIFNNEKLSYSERLVAFNKYNEIAQLSQEQVDATTAQMAKEDLDRKMANIKFYTDTAIASLNILSSINEVENNNRKAQYDEDKAFLDSQLENRVISREDYDRRVKALDAKADAEAKKAFEENKKIQIALALIQTFAGAASAYSSALANPISIMSGTAYAAVQAGIAVAAGLANVAKISSTQYKSTNRSGGGGGAIGGGGGGTPPSNPFKNNEAPSEVITLTSKGGKSGGQRVYVVESDISTVQNRVAVIENNAKIV